MSRKEEYNFILVEVVKWEDKRTTRKVGGQEGRRGQRAKWEDEKGVEDDKPGINEKTRCMVDITFHGTPPKQLKSMTGTFKFGMVEKKMKDVKKHYITTIHLMTMPTTSGAKLYGATLTSILDSKEMIKKAKRDFQLQIAESEKELSLREMANKYMFCTILVVQTRSLFQTWLDSRARQLACKNATIALNKAYQSEDFVPIGDFIVASKVLHKLTNRASINHKYR